MWRWLLLLSVGLSPGPAWAKPDIYEAARQGYLEAATKLLDQKSRRARRFDKYGKLPLHYAAGYAQPELVALLLEHGAEVNRADRKYATTALHELARTTQRDRGRIEATAETLIAAGADPRAMDSHGETPLLAASRVGNAVVVRRLLQHSAPSVDALATALRTAREQNRYEVIAALEAAGAHGTDGLASGLLTAATQGNYAVAEHLLETGAQVDVSDGNGQTPLMLAAAGGHLEVARLLLARHAAIDAQSADGRSALHLASAQAHAQVVELLVEHGADVNATSDRWGTPLNSAANEEAIHIVDFLLGQGARPRFVHDVPERAFGSGMALLLFVEHEDDALSTAEARVLRQQAGHALEAARAGWLLERAEHEKARRRKQRSDAFYKAVGSALAEATAATLQHMQEQQTRAAQKQLAQIAALKGATSYEDYHRRYRAYKDVMVNTATNRPFRLDLSDRTLANTASVSGLDVLISEYDRRIALTDNLLSSLEPSE